MFIAAARDRQRYNIRAEDGAVWQFVTADSMDCVHVWRFPKKGGRQNYGAFAKPDARVLYKSLRKAGAVKI